MLDGWREVDRFYADMLSQNLFMSVKHSREWQIFQWYDGITLERFHWSLEEDLDRHFSEKVNIRYEKTHSGCYWIAEKMKKLWLSEKNDRACFLERVGMAQFIRKKL